MELSSPSGFLGEGDKQTQVGNIHILIPIEG